MEKIVMSLCPNCAPLHDDFSMDLARRRALLIAARGFMQLPLEDAHKIRTLARWMNTSTGLGAVVFGMALRAPTWS